MKAVEYSRVAGGALVGAWLTFAAGGCALNFGLDPVGPPDADTTEDTQSDQTEFDTVDDGPDLPDEDGLDGDDPDLTDPDGFDTEDPDLDSTDPPVDDTTVDDVPAEELPDPYTPIEHYNMDLLLAVEGIPISSDPATLRVPDATRRSRWVYFLDDLLAGSYSEAYSRSISYSIEVFVVTDTGSTPSRDYIVAHDPNYGEGIYVFSVTPGHPLVVEVPYPLDDIGTRAEGVEMLRQANGWVLFMAGTTRCARSDTVICDGTTVACGGPPSNFRYSDVAHQPNLIFQTVHNYLSTEDPLSITVQVQGQADSSDAYAIVSDGTTIDDTSGISVELRNALRYWLPTYASDIWSCNSSADSSGYSSTCQVTNVQGRSSNGSASPCNVAAVSSADRFLVLELSTEIRGAAAFTPVASAVAGLFL